MYIKKILLTFLLVLGVVAVLAAPVVSANHPGQGLPDGGAGTGDGSGTGGSTPGDPNNPPPYVPVQQCQGGPSECVEYTPDPALTGCTGENCNLVQKYLNPLINILSILVGVAVVMGIIYGGIQYSASGGDPQKAAAAKTHIRNSVVALIVYFFLYAFLKFLVPGTGLITG